jgi:hypothetical protein
MLHDIVLSFLKTRPNAQPGETVQVGWLIFRITKCGEGLDIETLDFKSMGIFTKDFQIAEQIHWAQHETLRRLRAIEATCTLQNGALVSRSYLPGSSSAFIERCSLVSDTDSGWYVGVVDDQIDLEDPDSFECRSLYELTIQDERLARFWLLPVGYRVFFDGLEPRIEMVR